MPAAHSQQSKTRAATEEYLRINGQNLARLVRGNADQPAPEPAPAVPVVNAARRITGRRITDGPRLLTYLRRTFTLTPNYDRPLTDRVVSERCNADTGCMEPVTEHALAIRALGYRPGEWRGGRIHQVWTFCVDDRWFRFNSSYEHRDHHGVQELTWCPVCSLRTRDDPVSQQPRGLPWPNPLACRRCRNDRLTRMECDEHDGFACSTARKKFKCKCEACREWNRLDRQAERARKNLPAEGCGNLHSLEARSLEGAASGGLQASQSSRLCKFPHPAAGWTWLPLTLLEVLCMYERERAAWLDKAGSSELACGADGEGEIEQAVPTTEGER